MKDVSTRGIFTEKVDSAYAIKHGLADDGGLFMPESIPLLSDEELLDLTDKTYSERAAYVIGKFLTEFSVRTK